MRDGEHVVLVVGATRENRVETLSSLRKAFLIGGPIALVLAALGGYLLAGAALAPDRVDAAAGGRDLGDVARRAASGAARRTTRSLASARR